MQRDAKIAEHIRLAEKMVNYLCEYSRINSELDKSTVLSAAYRARAALREARTMVEQTGDTTERAASNDL